jgi:hypothetical protein
LTKPQLADEYCSDLNFYCPSRRWDKPTRNLSAATEARLINS